MLDNKHISVSIVPLWNWNLCWSLNQRREGRSQSYLYGIEMLNNTRELLMRKGLNRTFMELKWLRHKRMAGLCFVSIVPLWNWNQLCRDLLSSQLRVSIVPLWNWNRIPLKFLLRLLLSQSYLYGIEMKNWPSKRKSRRGLNRTFMELKSLSKWSYEHTLQSLNRTFMELKSNSQYMDEMKKLSQSYLYGIEIAVTLRSVTAGTRSQSYLYGIEIE